MIPVYIIYKTLGAFCMEAHWKSKIIITYIVISFLKIPVLLWDISFQAKYLEQNFYHKNKKE